MKSQPVEWKQWWVLILMTVTTAALDMVAIGTSVGSLLLTEGRVLSITAGSELETDDNLFHF
jgi:hypothetical protein